jgi:hypothetical protein
VENQATDRAFRIGQKRSVFVHKFVCRGTVEDKISGYLSRLDTRACHRDRHQNCRSLEIKDLKAMAERVGYSPRLIRYLSMFSATCRNQHKHCRGLGRRASSPPFRDDKSLPDSFSRSFALRILPVHPWYEVAALVQVFRSETRATRHLWGPEESGLWRHDRSRSPSSVGLPLQSTGAETRADRSRSKQRPGSRRNPGT